jgi:hypothetical protein
MVGMASLLERAVDLGELLRGGRLPRPTVSQLARERAAKPRE